MWLPDTVHRLSPIWRLGGAPDLQRIKRGLANVRLWQDVLLRRLQTDRRIQSLLSRVVAMLLGHFPTSSNRIPQPDLLQGCERSLHQSLRALEGTVAA